MNNKKHFLLLFLIGLSALHLSAQKADSLKAVVDTAKGIYKVKTLNELFRANLLSDPSKALAYTHEALAMATEIGDKRGMAASNNNHGVAYRNQGALDKALEYYLNSLKLYQELDNKEGIATTKNNIANIYSIKKDFARALPYLEESYQMFVALGAQPQIIGSMNNLGNLYSDIQLNEKAMKYFNDAYELSEKAGDKFADPLINIGNLYFKDRNYKLAIEYYEKALAIEKEENNKLGQLNIVTNLGITYTKANETVKASAYLKEALALSEELNASTNLPTVYKTSAENYAKQGKMKEAYETQLKYEEVREKIYGDESSRNIAQMEMVLRFQEKERAFDLLKKQDEIKSLELNNRNLIILLIVLSVLITIGSFNFLYLSKKKIIKTKRQD